MEYILPYVLPAVVLFAVQTALCLWCKSPLGRLVPVLIILGIAAYHTAIIIDSMPLPWAVMSIPYLLLTVLPSAVGVGLGWIIYVIRLMAQAISEAHRPQ